MIKGDWNDEEDFGDFGSWVLKWTNLGADNLRYHHAIVTNRNIS